MIESSNEKQLRNKVENNKASDKKQSKNIN